MKIISPYVYVGLVRSESMTIHLAQQYIEEHGLKSKKKVDANVYRRYFLYLVIKNSTKLTLEKIGELLGRDHSIVHFGINRAQEVIDNPKTYQKQIQYFDEVCNKLII